MLPEGFRSQFHPGKIDQDQDALPAWDLMRLIERCGKGCACAVVVAGLK